MLDRASPKKCYNKLSILKKLFFENKKGYLYEEY